MSEILAHAISKWTLLGYTGPVFDYYVDYNNNVRRFNTGDIVAENITNVKDAEKLDIGSPIYGKDIYSGHSMTVKTEPPKEHIGITISQMTVSDNSWEYSKSLDSRLAIRMLHKWFIEHKWMALYNKKTNMTPMRAFIHWVMGEHFGTLSCSNKFQWYNNAMKIDFEMETRNCSFEDCHCDMTVPIVNTRHIIPHQYYDKFGLLNREERNSIWEIGKPTSEADANMLLHSARMNNGY